MQFNVFSGSDVLWLPAGTVCVSGAVTNRLERSGYWASTNYWLKAVNAQFRNED